MKEQNAQKGLFSRIKTWFFSGDNRAKIIFLLLSIFLWSMIKLNKEGYTAELKYNISYSDFPTDLKLEEAPQEKLRIGVKTHGFALLSEGIRPNRELEINVSEDLHSAGDNRYYWSAIEHQTAIKALLDDDMELLSIAPDTIWFNFKKLVTKRVPVRLNMDLKTQDFNTLSGRPELVPDSITIKGTANALKKINDILTQKFVISDAKDSVVRKVPLDVSKLKEIEYNTTQIEVRYKMDKLTQKVFRVPVNIERVPDTLSVVPFPREVKLSCNVPVEMFDKVQPNNFYIYADFEEINSNPQAQYLNLKLSSYPTFIKEVQLTPKRIEFIATNR